MGPDSYDLGSCQSGVYSITELKLRYRAYRATSEHAMNSTDLARTDLGVNTALAYEPPHMQSSNLRV